MPSPPTGGDDITAEGRKIEILTLSKAFPIDQWTNKSWAAQKPNVF